MIPVARPLLGDAEIAAAARVLRSGWVTQGPEVAAFEAEFAAYVGAPHACAVSNCTTALHLALLATGVGPGDEVITVSHSFIATANAIRYCGAEPVFVDVDADTFNMDPASVRAAIGPRTRAILCVHQMGMPCDLAGLLAIAEARGIPLIEDAACAIGSEIAWLGSWEQIGRPRGHVACFSFHPRKVVTTGDGGMLTTRDPDLDRSFRLLRQHGMSIPDTKRHSSAQVLVEAYPVLGFNYRMTDIQAAIGREQLRRLPELLAERRTLAARYSEMLADVGGITPPFEPAYARGNWQSYCVRLDPQADQRSIMQAMLDRGVATRRGIMCAHREPAYAASATRWDLPRSESCQDHGLILPLFPGMTREDQRRVVDGLAESLEAIRPRSRRGVAMVETAA